MFLKGNNDQLLNAKFQGVASLTIAGLLLASWLCFPAITLAEAKVALVIGNSDYQEAPLVNPVNDAMDMADILRKLDFDVLLQTNINRKQMRQAIRDFGDKLKRSDVGLFYFAGHGIQIDGKNYLVPLATNVQSSDEVQDESIDANSVLRKMETAGNNVNIVILDACRNNPFARSFRSLESGLARMDGPVGSYIAYATAPGSVALDGSGRNGLYTQYLLKALNQPGLTIEQTFKAVRIGVRRDTGGKQIPWESSSLIGEFKFLPENNQVVAVVPPPPQVNKRHLQVITNVSNAKVTVNNQQHGLTDNNGVLNIPNLVNNEVEIVVTADGYLQQSKKVKLVSGQWQQLNLELQPNSKSITNKQQPRSTPLDSNLPVNSCFKGQKILLNVHAEFQSVNARVQQKSYYPQINALFINAMKKQQLKVVEFAQQEQLDASAGNYAKLADRYKTDYAISAFVSTREVPITAVKTKMRSILVDITIKLINLATAEVLTTKTNSFQQPGMSAKVMVKKAINNNINSMMREMFSQSCPRSNRSVKKGFFKRMGKVFNF